MGFQFRVKANKLINKKKCIIVIACMRFIVLQGLINVLSISMALKPHFYYYHWNNAIDHLFQFSSHAVNKQTKNTNI